MSYIDTKHRKAYEDGYVRQAKEWGLTHHLTLTVKPGRGERGAIRTAGYAAKVADSLAWYSCSGHVIGVGDIVDGGQPHVHVLTTRGDSRRLRDAWMKAGHGHVEVTSVNDDIDAFMSMTLYVYRKITSDRGADRGLVYVDPTKRSPGHVSDR